MVLPLLPLILELGVSQSVSDKMMTLAASMYTIAIGLSSRNRLLFGIAMFLSVSLALAFGFATPGGGSIFGIGIWYISAGSILLVFVLHIGERYNRHVAEGRSFLRFDREED